MKMEKCSQYSTSDVVKLLQKKSQKNIATRYWSRNCLWSAAVAALALTILSGALLLINWPTIDVQQMKNTPYTPPVLSCYYSPVSVEDSGLQPDDIHPHLCTHINIAFAVIHNKSLILDQKLHAGIKRLVLMKNENPDLKILLSVGGGGNDKGFSDMVVDHASRKTFIRSIKNILRNYTLDGIDLDWEFPNVHDAETGSHKRERQHFSQLLREIRMEYIREKRNYLLTVAVAAPKTIVDTAYDVDQLNMYVDFVNLMTYDFHFFSRITPFTGFNSPLYGEESEQFLLGTLNINYTVHMYMDKGLARNKIVVGIPTYAHTFTLVN